jgi:hypothetical protein
MKKQVAEYKPGKSAFIENDHKLDMQRDLKSKTFLEEIG